MLGARTDTSYVILEWAMSKMFLNPSMMRKVLEDSESVVGLKCNMKESDLPATMYIMLEYRYNHMV